MGSLNASIIFICKSNYIIWMRLLRQLPSSRRPRAQSFGNHIDDPGRRLISRRFFSRLGSSVGNGLSRQIPPKFIEISLVDESFDLILKLDALLGIVAVAPVESAVLPSIEAFCLQRRRPSQVLFPLDLHQNLRTESRKRSIGVIPGACRPWSLPSG